MKGLQVTEQFLSLTGPSPRPYVPACLLDRRWCSLITQSLTYPFTGVPANPQRENKQAICSLNSWWTVTPWGWTLSVRHNAQTFAKFARSGRCHRPQESSACCNHRRNVNALQWQRCWPWQNLIFCSAAVGLAYPRLQNRCLPHLPASPKPFQFNLKLQWSLKTMSMSGASKRA